MLGGFRARAEAALDQRLPAPNRSPELLHQAMRYAILNGGKRVRACLVYATGMALGVEPEPLDVPACAVEMIHGYSLVHDDLPCMDDDDVRRGNPSCHKAFDEATALLVGDALQALAFEILANDDALDISAKRRTQMIAALATASGSYGMAGGQAIDLAAVGQTLTLAELENMHRLKTGTLIRASVRLGALTSEGVTEDSLQALDSYAQQVGLAFQITDDILDVEGDARTLGKTPGSDQAHNKPTYPAIMGLPAAKEKRVKLTESALSALLPLGDAASVLAGLARYVIQRSR
ncbi:MAG: (2E,6E)-farnesyl diphosphate synthase [Gammaproteobacteria bacterium]|jgi:farnesyl diphosphate synthase|nr:(2E,6E)-farnesyl diphosphate synthase [Gammaproteobacteria bacterium]